MNGERLSTNTIILGIVGVFVTTILAAAAVLIFAPEGVEVGPLLAALPPTVAALGALAVARNVGERVEERVERVEQTTEELANGTMDAKIRAGIADALPESALDDTYRRHQLAADRMRRRQRNADHTEDPPDPGN